MRPSKKVRLPVSTAAGGLVHGFSNLLQAIKDIDLEADLQRAQSAGSLVRPQQVATLLKTLPTR
jgi:hypothetical protein